MKDMPLACSPTVKLGFIMFAWCGLVAAPLGIFAQQIASHAVLSLSPSHQPNVLQVGTYHGSFCLTCSAMRSYSALSSGSSLE